jgi:hypothetical protein
MKRVDTMLKEAKERVAGGRSRSSRRRGDDEGRGGSRRWKATSTSVVASSFSRIGKATVRQAKGSSRAVNWDVEGTLDPRDLAKPRSLQTFAPHRHNFDMKLCHRLLAALFLS